MGRIRLFQNGSSQSSRFPIVGRGERRLWERDCLCVKTSEARETTLANE